MRRCHCGIWFEYDALVKDDALECPECGRILPRGAREAWTATRLGRSLALLAGLFGLVLAVGGLAGGMAFLDAGETAAGVLTLVGGVLLAGVVVVLSLTVRALADSVSRLEDRVP